MDTAAGGVTIVDYETLDGGATVHASSPGRPGPQGGDGADGADGADGSASIAVIADQKSAGTQGGGFTSGAWRTRDLNTEVSDVDGIGSISSNQFTPVAGTYIVMGSAPAYSVDSHQTRIRNVTAGT